MQRRREILMSGGREGGGRLRFSRVTHYLRVHLKRVLDMSEIFGDSFAIAVYRSEGWDRCGLSISLLAHRTLPLLLLT